MNRKYRRPLIAGNWKMNMLPSEAVPYAKKLCSAVGQNANCDVVICAPFIVLPEVISAFEGSCIFPGAQNISEYTSGAYTGEVSASQLLDAGVKYVIAGHSERRQYFLETDVIVNKKVCAALNAGIRPIICVGESLVEREMGIVKELISFQVKSALYTVPKDKVRNVIIAYEPIWAIGTDKTATPDDAEDTCARIRSAVKTMFDDETARSITLLYGGAMNEKNAADLLAQPDIDGGLIGRASLDPVAFSKIVEAASID